MKKDRTQHEQVFSVSYTYPVAFTRNLFEPANALFEETVLREGEGPHKLIAFVDKGVASAHPDLCKNISSYCEARTGLDLVRSPTVVTGGEAIKNDYHLVMEILDTILEYRLCRHSFVVAVGGGAALDAIGFAASLVHRGLRVIRVPTTVLAQNDAGVGVKTGMNLHGGKNTIGTFHPPFAVLNDSQFLTTLSDRDWRGGIAEAFKVAIIKDAVFFDALCEDAERLCNRDLEAMERLIQRCAELHLEHIRTEGDPFEYGKARPLDFGHWSAHKLETMSRYEVGHGEAVGIGIALDSYYAAQKGWISATERDRILDGLYKAGLKLWHPLLQRRLGDGTLELLGGLDDFREHLGGKLCVTFPHELGRRIEVHTVERSILEEGIVFLKDHFKTPAPAENSLTTRKTSSC
jgi:3-dehydroquinate synthase